MSDNNKKDSEKSKDEKNPEVTTDTSSPTPRPGILTKEEEEEIAINMNNGKRDAIIAALDTKCMEKAIDNLLEWVMREKGRIWRYLEDPRDEGVGETSMSEAIETLKDVRKKLGRSGRKLSQSYLILTKEEDLNKIKNIKRRIRRANKNRFESFFSDLGYIMRIEFFDDLAEQFRKANSDFYSKMDELTFIEEYGVPFDEFKRISGNFFRGEKLFQKSREDLILANQRLVIYFARKYQEQGVDLADLIGEGNIGLLRAVERFNPGKGSRLATYATWWIKHNLNRAVANQGSTIRVPGHVREEKNRIMKIISKLSLENGKEPSKKEISEHLEIPIERINHIMRRTQGTISIDKPLGYESDDETLQKLLPDEAVLTPEEEVSKAFDKQWVKELLMELKPRERLIIEMRYGITGKDAMTLQEVGVHLKITRERVRQLQTKAEEKLLKIARKKGYFKK